MDDKTFEEKIKQGLKELTPEQQITFAWRCAVRALPFLGSSGNFDYWEQEDRQEHLYSIFDALDFSALAALADLADLAARAARADLADLADLATRDARAARAAALAARAARAAALADRAARDALADLAARAARAARDAARTSSTIDSVMFMESILHDLHLLKTGGGGRNNTALYGKIWDNFQQALKKEDCEYWGKIYEDIFRNGLVPDDRLMDRMEKVPEEIKDQGAAAVGHFMEELEAGENRLNEARIIILGEKGAGKTCLARKLIDPKAAMTKPNESTAGVQTTVWKLGADINAHIWDFAGHVVTHAAHQCFLSERCLYIIVYDGRTEERNRLEYWLDHVKNYGEDSEAILMVNIRDKHKPDIPINRLKEKYPIAGVHFFSIQDDSSSLNEFRTVISSYIENKPSWDKQKIPATYYKVKQELEALFSCCESENSKDFISKETFDRIAKEHKAKNPEQLLKDLHALGISLWYKDLGDFNTLVLNPDWISNGIYKIINWVFNNDRYSIAKEDFVAVFEEEQERYPAEKHEFLFKLMIKYELAFETKNGGELIIPHLLKEDRPDVLPDFPLGESLMLRFKAESPLPPNTISRFIVRQNERIQKKGDQYFVWRFGVVLEGKRGTIALIREEDRTISVSVTGVDKTNFISILREDLNQIFNSYKSDKPDLQYRIEFIGEAKEIRDTEPLWESDEKIKNFHKKGRQYINHKTDEEIPLERVINEYKIHIVREEINRQTEKEQVEESKKKMNPTIIVAIIGAVATILAVIIPKLLDGKDSTTSKKDTTIIVMPSSVEVNNQDSVTNEILPLN